MLSIILLLALLQQPSARVEGVVVDAINGAPLKDVQVLLRVGAEYRYRRVVTDSAGAFGFDDVVPGDTVLAVSREGYLGSTLTESVSANIRNSRRVALTPAPAISGRIYDSSFKTVAADAQGRFVISGIRPGNYTVFAISDKLGPAVHLTPYLNYGTPVEVDKGQHIQQDLTLIPRQ